MMRIPGWSQPVAPAVLTPGAGPASALLTGLPDTLRNLAVGALLSGTVLTRDSSGLTMLQTGAGVFGVKTTVPLPPGSNVTLQVQSAGAQLQAIVLSVTPQASGRGAPAAPALPAPAAPPASPSPSAAASPAALDGPASPPSSISATVIGPPGGQPSPSARAAGPLPGLSSTLNAPAGQAAPDPAPALAPQVGPSTTVTTGGKGAPIQAGPPNLSATPPAAAAPTPSATPGPPAAVNGAPLPVVAEASRPVAPDPSPTATTNAAGRTADAETPVAPLPTGTKVQVRLVPGAPTGAPTGFPSEAARATAPAPMQPAIVAPRGPAAAALGGSPAAPGAAPTPPSIALAATLVARTPTGQTIVDTAAGRLIIALPAAMDAMPPGTRIALELMLPGRPAAFPPWSAPAGNPGALARDWPALRDVVRMLLDSPDEAVRNAVDRAMPRPGPRFGPQVLAFIERAGAGGVKEWLGEAAWQRLERLSGPGLLARLDHELHEILVRRGNEGQWHMTVVPLLDGQDIRQIRFFERRKKKGDGNKDREDTARFVVECEHGEFGSLQLDGLMHDRRLDLIMRSHDRLPEDVESDILSLFNLVCAGLGLTGKLAFQAVAAFPVNPLDEFAAGGVQVSV